jgi:hypothetical protein
VLAFAVWAGTDKIPPPVLDGLINQGQGNQDPEVPLSRQIEVQLAPLTSDIEHLDYGKAIKDYGPDWRASRKPLLKPKDR